MEPREWEQKIEEMMLEDEWPDLPVSGEKLSSAWSKIISYIEWLRGAR